MTDRYVAFICFNVFSQKQWRQSRMTVIDVAYIHVLMFLVSESGDRREWLLLMLLLYVFMF